MENSMEVPQKTKNTTTIWPGNSTPGDISEKKKILIWKDTCTQMMFIEALFIITKMWKQPKCPSTDEWRRCDTHTRVCVHMYNGILLSHKKE